LGRLCSFFSIFTIYFAKMTLFIARFLRRICIIFITTNLIFCSAKAQTWSKSDKYCDGRIRFTINFYGSGNPLVSTDVNNQSTVQYKNSAGNWVTFFSVYYASATGYGYGSPSTGCTIESSATNIFNIAFDVQEAYNVPIDFRFNVGTNSGIYTGTSYGPNMPSGLTASVDQSCDKVSLSWTNPTMTNLESNCTGTNWDVQVFRDGGYIGTGGKSGAYEDLYATKGYTHSYTIRTHATSKNANQTSFNDTYSPVTAGVSGRRIGAMGTPTAFAATTNQCDNVKLTWSWTGNNPSSFVIYRSPSYFGSYTPLAEPSGTDRQYLDQPSDRGVTYYYKVASKNTCGDISGFSTSVSGQRFVVPAAPSNIQAVALSGKIKVSWTDNATNEDGFSIVRTAIASGNQQTFTVGKGILEYQDAGVTLCQNYKYEVFAIDPCKTTNLSGGSVSIMLAPDLNNFFLAKGLKVSKGYYSDKVLLTWSTNMNARLVNTYKISRRLAGTTDPYVLINTMASGATIWQDNYADAGVLYQYSLSAEGTCDTSTIYSNTINDIGFRTPSGIVSGHIDYEGGVAVENVNVLVEKISGSNGTAIAFDGTSNYVSITNKAQLNPLNKVSVQMWVKPASLNANAALLSKSNGNNGYILSYEKASNSTLFSIYNGTSFITARCKDSLKVGTYTHVTGTYDGAYVRLYVNGSLIDSAASTTNISSNTANLMIGSSSLPSNFFNGTIDEIRLWNVGLSSTLVKRDYTRILSGDETGLIGYWRADENTGINIFDASKTGSVFNENHGDINGAVTWTTLVPTNEQLGLKGITDVNGNYIINNIRYSGSGNNFTLTPYIGQHTFSPSSSVLFIGEGASVHNNQNFKDISSFKVTGTVKYANTSCFSNDVFLYIDGQQVIKNGQAIKTDASGFFEINVPIGYHAVSIGKSGHGFSPGIYPGVNQKRNFLGPVTGLVFMDTTLINVIGRVVGGTREGNKKAGFGKSVNNIGTARITFESQQGGGCKKDTVYTNSQSGEYKISLPPMKYIVSSVTIPADLGINFGTLATLDLTAIRPVATAFDTVYLPGSTVIKRIDSIHFHVKNDYIYRVNPEISITNRDASPFSGDSLLFYKDNRTNFVSTVNLNSNPFDYPVFTGGNTYEAKISLFEKYVHPVSKIEDKVPVTDAKLTLHNDLSNTPEEIINLVKGDTIYTFMGGEPNVLTDIATPGYSYTKTFQVIVETGSKTTDWKPNGKIYRAYVFGAKSDGNNFATDGPQVVDAILRDPPGSGSSAYINKGTSHTSYEHWTTDLGTTVKLDKAIMLGTEFTIGLGYTTRTKLINTLHLGLELHTHGSFGGGLENTVTTTEKFETSTAPAQAGAASDLFMGKSVNFIYGTTTNLLILPDSVCSAYNMQCFGASNGGFRIGKRMGMFAVPGGFSTMFVYSQDHIENHLIPSLMKLRNSLFSKPNYISKVNAKHPNFGTNNDDPAWGAAATSTNTLKTDAADYNGPSYRCDTVGTHSKLDSVRWYNQQMRLWRDALAQNEQEKFNAESDKNISFNAGSTTSYDYSSSKNEITTNSFEVVVNESFGLKITAEIGGNGVEANQSLVINQTYNKNWGDNNETSNGYGYTLTDGDAGDFYSVDVKKVKTGNGPVFKTVGGQSACPWEEKHVVKYPWKLYVDVPETTYVKGKKVIKNTKEWKGAYDRSKIGSTLSEATMRREVPVLTATPYEVFNVPENGAAVFTLNLGNASESGDMMWYRLGLIESSNPKGAKLAIDGSSVSRVFDIPAGATISKQLTISKGPVENDYTNIKLILYSQCEYDNFMNGGALRAIDTISLSVHFVPACSDIKFLLPTDQWVVNSSNHDTLNMVVGGYDINFPSLKNFQIEYKPATSATWIGLQKFYKDTLGMKDKTLKPIPKVNPYTLYPWDMSQLIDGNYNIRATTHCPLAEASSKIFSGIVDRVNPHPFGSPQPADGILSPNDEIMIQFNEKINEGKLTWDNFDIRGVLNGTKISNGTSVKFDGIDKYAKIPDGINLSSKSFTTEFWLKRSSNGEQCILSQGNSESNGLYIGFDAGNKFFINLAGTVVSTNLPYTDTDWHHWAVSYNNLGKVIQLFYDGAMVKNSGASPDYSGTGEIALGKSKFGATRYINGNMHELRIWNTVKSQSNIVAKMNTELTGKESGLLGNWRMDEARGTLIEDRVHHRNGTIYADWQVDPTGRAFAFDGVDDYLEMDGSKIALTKEMDFSIEFWIKASQGNNVCLFSNGKGDGTDANTSGWTINTDATGQIFVNNNGMTYKAVSNNIFDNNWHHFALVVRRSGNTSSYVNGELQNSQSSTQWQDFGGSKIWLGNRSWFTGVMQSHDQHFAGKMDEVRIWNLARKQDQIRLDMNSRLSGDEFGLMGYFPFENFTQVAGVNQLSETLADQSKNVNLCKAYNGAAFSLETPNIKLKRPVEKVNFTYAVNQDKIIFTPTDLPNRIENCILSITVKDVSDMNGNFLQSPETWIAYIDKNQVKWKDQQMDLEKLLYAPLTFNTSITNSGGAQEAYSIDNLPAWLTATPQSGTLQPNSSQGISFKVNEGLNIGNYGQDIYLHTSFDFDEKLLLNLKVYEKAPVWTVDPSKFLYSMNIIGQLSIDSIYSTNPNDVVAAFVGNELRGVANLQYIPGRDIYLVFMSIYSNIQSGEVVNLRVWNASEGKSHVKVTPTLSFVMNDLVGSLNNPTRINATNTFSSYIPLKNGWNWTSFNLRTPTLSNMNILLNNVKATTGNLVKGKDGFDGYDATYGWSGSITGTGGIKNESMYKLFVSHSDTIKYSGVSLNPLTQPIAIASGWNWIGYIPQINMEINDAFGKYNPVAGDLVKSQFGFAVYDPSLGWVGNLKFLIPTQGYMLFAANSGSLTYPKEGLFSSNKMESQKVQAPVLVDNINHQHYQFNMSVIAEVTGNVVISEKDILKVYAGHECRGMAYPQIIDSKRVFFLAVDGNTTKELLSFKLLRNSDGKEIEILETSSFMPNDITGTIYEPYPLTLSNASINPASNFTGSIYPNPFTQGVTISLNLKENDYLDVNVVDLLGREIYNVHYANMVTGQQKISWDGNDAYGYKIPSGVYIIKVSTSKGKLFNKLTKTE
jgi:hypothetical protein